MGVLVGGDVVEVGRTQLVIDGVGVVAPGHGLSWPNN